MVQSICEESLWDYFIDVEPISLPTQFLPNKIITHKVGEVEAIKENGKWRFNWLYKDASGRQVVQRLYPDGTVGQKRVYPTLMKLRKKNRTIDGKYLG